MRVFNVPASAPFLRTVIAALVDGRLVHGFNARAQPERLTQATLYLPTRRAGRMAREIFLDVLGTDAVLLPRIVALGDIDEDELEFAQAASGTDLASLDTPPALDGIHRRLLLAQLIAAWARGLKPGDPAQAPLVLGGPASTLALSDDLARLIDDMTTRGVDWRALDGLVPDALDQYWQLTLRFLNIARDVWPDILKAHGRIEPAARRDLLIEAEAARLTGHINGPVIAAGSTGSMPATAKFLKVIAGLPQGAVVLPGLDTDLDDEAWQLIGGVTDAHGRISATASNHPQFAMHALLEKLGLKRGDVESLAMPAPHGRELLMSEAMRPSNATAQWHRRLAEPEVEQRISAGMTNLAVIEAPNSEMEALAIAVAMREARELDKSAALVTPDRALARRVMAALGRWNLQFDDSGGDALMDTPAGIFARLAAETVSKQLEPPTLLALLKHPLLRLGGVEGAFRNAVETLELALLRGTRPAAGSAGLARDFVRFREELAKLRRKETSTLHYAELRTKLKDTDLDHAAALIAQLPAALARLESIDPSTPHDFSELAERHRDVLMALSRDENRVAGAFEGQQGLALAAAFDDLLGSATRSGLIVRLGDYPEVFQTAFGDRIVRRPQVADTHLRIYGPLDARLTQCDRVILGGLIEGVWPPAPRNDPWLSRPMRHELGLDLPERRIGLSAHDFAQLLGAREVFLTHAAKVAGSPTVPSRFIQRLAAVAGKRCWDAAKARGENHLAWARALDRPEQPPQPAERPAPTPPRAARPQSLSVTEIEHWLRDPYTIYAKHILKLMPLDAVDTDPGAAARGTIIHAAIGDFTKRFAKALPADPAAELIALGEPHFAALEDFPEAQAFWWPRFRRVAHWFANWERARRGSIAEILAEIRGKTEIALAGGAFTLTGIADRIERGADGRYVILDYKTGAARSEKQIRTGLAPQLTLEAAILRRGGFKDIAAGASVAAVGYVLLRGGEPPGEDEPIAFESGTPDEHADRAYEKLAELARRFDDDSVPYRSLVHPMWKTYYGAYDHLARVKEWSSSGGAGDDSGSGG